MEILQRENASAIVPPLLISMLIHQRICVWTNAPIRLIIMGRSESMGLGGVWRPVPWGTLLTPSPDSVHLSATWSKDTTDNQYLQWGHACWLAMAQPSKTTELGSAWPSAKTTLSSYTETPLLLTVSRLAQFICSQTATVTYAWCLLTVQLTLSGTSQREGVWGYAHGIKILLGILFQGDVCRLAPMEHMLMKVLVFVVLDVLVGCTKTILQTNASRYALRLLCCTPKVAQWNASLNALIVMPTYRQGPVCRCALQLLPTMPIFRPILASNLVEMRHICFLTILLEDVLKVALTGSTLPSIRCPYMLIILVGVVWWYAPKPKIYSLIPTPTSLPKGDVSPPALPSIPP